MNDPSFCSQSLAKLNQSETKIAMCVSFPSILQKHSNQSELRSRISVRFSEMGGKHHVQEIPIRKATCPGRWPGREKLQCRDRKVQLPLSLFIQLSDCHRVGSGSPVLATTSHLPAGKAGLSSGVGFPMDTEVLSHSPAPPVDRELLAVPKTQGPPGLSQGKELGRGHPCQLCSSAQGVWWSSQRFCFSSSDSS